MPKNLTVIRSLFYLGCALAMCGCDQLFGAGSSSDGPTGGTDCTNTFQWENCPNANWCASTTPLAKGSKAVMRTAENCGWTTVTSTNPSVAQAMLTAKDEVTVQGGSPGTTYVTLSRNGSSGISVPVVISAPDRIIADNNLGGTNGLVLLNNNVGAIHFTLASSGSPIVGGSGIHYGVTGTLSAVNAIDPSGGFLFTGQPGSGTVTATIGALTLSVPIQVAADTDVTSVSIVPMQSSDGFTGSLTLDVTVLSGSTPIFVYPCAWSTSPDSLAQVATSGGTIATTATTHYQFSGPPGAYILSCRIGNQPREFQVQL